MSTSRASIPLPLAALGRAIALRRIDAAMTQADLAARVGVKAYTVGRFEQGADVPFSLLHRVAGALGVSLTDLVAEAAKCDLARTARRLQPRAIKKDRTRKLVLREVMTSEVPISAGDIAAVTGCPRRTVQRHLAALLADGHVESMVRRDAQNGGLYIYYKAAPKYAYPANHPNRIGGAPC